MSETPPPIEGPNPKGESAPVPAPALERSLESLQRVVLWLRGRKVVQWGLAYLVIAFGLMQGVALVADTMEWPHIIGRLTLAALATGFPAVLVLAWYHGDRGLRHTTRLELGVLSMIAIVGTALAVNSVPLRGPGTANAHSDEMVGSQATPVEAAMLHRRAASSIRRYCAGDLVSVLRLPFVPDTNNLPSTVRTAVSSALSHLGSAQQRVEQAREAACRGAQSGANPNNRVDRFLGGTRSIVRLDDTFAGVQDEGRRLKLGFFDFTDSPLINADHAYLAIGAVEFQSGDVFLGQAGDNEHRRDWNEWGAYIFAEGGFHLGYWRVLEGSLPGVRRYADGSFYVGEFRHVRRFGYDLVEDGYGAKWSSSGALESAGHWQLGEFVGTER